MQVTTDFKEGDEPPTRINGTVPFFWDLASPGILSNSHDHHVRGSDGVLVESQRGRGPIQESPYWSMSSTICPIRACVCEVVCLLHDILALSSFLSSKEGDFWAVGSVPWRL
jgi:hypothetical protein